MAAESGRDLRISYNAGAGMAVVAGARSDSLTFNNEAIDITDKDDAGVRTYLDDVSLKSMSMSCTGVAKAATYAALAQAAGSGTALHDFQIEFGSFATYSGQFFITSFESTGEQADTMTFTMSLESSGAITVS